MPVSTKTLFSLSNRVASHWPWFLIWGLLLLIVGFFAVSMSMVTSILSMITLGIVLLIAGVVLLVDAIKYWSSSWSAFLLHFIIALLYIFAGFFLIKSPLLGSISLTFFLGVIYLVAGLIRIATAFSSRLAQWGWVLLSGIIAVVIGVLILGSWPTSGLYLIGLFVGIDLIFIGWSYVMIAFALRSIVK